MERLKPPYLDDCPFKRVQGLFAASMFVLVELCSWVSPISPPLYLPYVPTLMKGVMLMGCSRETHDICQVPAIYENLSCYCCPTFSWAVFEVKAFYRNQLRVQALGFRIIGSNWV